MHLDTRLITRACAAALLLSLATCSEGPALLARPLGDFKSGLITYYDADGGGNCSFERNPDDMNVAAIIKSEYQGSAVCGACAEVEGPLGTVVVRIVDSCPGCEHAGHLDLSPQAFEKVARKEDGRVQVRWRFVSCPVSGPLHYRFKESSNQWWAAIQVRNHHLPIQKLEVWKHDHWVALPREDYNYFVESGGVGTGSIRVRVTSSTGQAVEDTLPGVKGGKTFEGKAQFPQQP
jgi:expansin (peptidoglycan-binding protein)